MRNFLIFIIVTLLSIALDIAWFGYIGGPYYIDAIGSMLRQASVGFSPDILSAVGVYLLLVLGIMLFVLPRANKSPARAIFWGAMYGLVVYGTYNFTNYSTLANWPGNICFIDIGWGIVFCGILSAIGAWLQKKFQC